MACSGKMEVEFEIKSKADKFWECIKDSAAIFPKALSHDYKSIEVLEGSGMSAGSIRLIIYAEDSPLVKISKEKIDSFDDANKTYTYCVIDGDLTKYYKVFKGKLVVTPKPDGGSLVKWSSEFEKTSQDIPDPNLIKDFVVKNFIEIDDYLLHQLLFNPMLIYYISS